MNETELTTLCLCSFRYALTRKTGVSYEISEILIKQKDYLPEWAKQQIVRDIDIELEADKFNKFDHANWMNVVESFEE